MFEVKRYSPEDFDDWNAFVHSSKNGTFMLDRRYMDYHADRFSDHSLMIEKNGQLVAVFPAHEKEGQMFSHQGLTYGGMILPKQVKLREVITVFSVVLKHYFQNGFDTLLYKGIPSFYHHRSSFEEGYVMFLLDAQLERMDTSFVVNLGYPLKLQNRRKREVKKGVKAGLEVREDVSFDKYWNEVLTPNLMARFGTKPVHSLEEISSLGQHLPDNIKQYSAYNDHRILAGATMFINGNVAHAQYISASEEGKEVGAIDFLFHQLITEVFKHYDYFSFGRANEPTGRALNIGLTDWKEGFGTEVYLNPFYLVKCENFKNLASFLIN